MEHMLNIDIETFSSVPITSGGLYKYAQSPDFSVLLFGYSLDGAPPVCIDLTRDDLPDWIANALTDKSYTKRAYNAAFEWYCLSRYIGRLLPIDQWQDTQLQGLYCGYPAGLDATCKALGMSEDKAKLKTGKALIRIFCVPTTPTKSNGQRTRTLPQHEPEKWKLFIEYNKQDVVAEQEIGRLLSPWPVPEAVQHQWQTDIRINYRGIAIDTDLVNGALDCAERSAEDSESEAKNLTGLCNPNSVSQLKQWLADELGQQTEDLRKDTVSELLCSNLADIPRRVLELRQELGKTSTKKYDAMVNGLCDDGRIRGTLQFYGASRTGRWAGRMIQVQNLPRTHLPGIDMARDLVKHRSIDDLRMLYGSVPDTLSQLIRTALIPAEGYYFVDADYSAIEARVIAWLAGEDWVLDVFRTHGKIYEATASQMFGVPIEKIKKGNPEYSLRQKGKVATLALGYGGGASALIRMGALKGGIPENELEGIKTKWRETNPHIVQLWRECENAAISAVEEGGVHPVNAKLAYTTELHNGICFLEAILPSGRSLFYANPFLTENRWGGKSLGHYGMNQTTKKWEKQSTYGGKLVENITQAVARDCLAGAIDRLDADGFRTVFHVHDEIIVEMPEKEYPDHDAALELISGLMSTPIPWAPGLPLRADGWTGDYYTKD